MSDIFGGPRHHHGHPGYPTGARHYWQQGPPMPHPPPPHPHPHPHPGFQHPGPHPHPPPPHPHAYPNKPQGLRCAAAGCGDVAGSPGGFCRHHSCKKTQCPLGRIEESAYCLKHACDVSTCSRSKLDTSAYCNQHACQYPGCKSCKRGAWTIDGVTSEACEDHVCQSTGCAHPRRTHRPYCRDHSCGWSGRSPCNQEVEANSRACRDHVCQFEGSCLSVRKVKTNGQACDEHTCRIAGCYRAIGIRGRYCREHTCVWEPCSQRGLYGGSPFCDTHKCQTKGCQAAVATKLDAYCVDHKCRYGGGTCLGGFRSGGPPYCEDHICEVRGCGLPVDWQMTVCTAHFGYEPPVGRPTSGPGKKASSVVSGGGRKTPKHKVGRREAYVEDTDPSMCSSCDEKAHKSTGKKRSSRKAKTKTKTPPPPPASNAGSMVVRRANLNVAVAERREVAVQPDIASYATARWRGYQAPTPEVFRTDPNLAIAYGCGLQDGAQKAVQDTLQFVATMCKNGEAGKLEALAQNPAAMARNQQDGFGPGSFDHMARHLPTFEGPRVMEED